VDERETASQYLLIDADDTLWENERYFQDATDQFIDFLAHTTLSRTEIRQVLNEITYANLEVRGYGAGSFARNMQICFQRLSEREWDDKDLDIVLEIGEGILRKEREILIGVEETLLYLQQRYALVLFTKGHPDEQREKIDQSGLERFFHRAVITPEKNPAAYSRLVTDLNADPGISWMIGNSPKSDINPALAIGLNAVHIPHHVIWELEHQELVSAGPGRLLQLKAFAELRNHF
jgi:putative hydrolase of the HAD superfamily